jgi:hypothetical protein
MKQTGITGNTKVSKEPNTNTSEKCSRHVTSDLRNTILLLLNEFNVAEKAEFSDTAIINSIQSKRPDLAICRSKM